MSIVLGPLDTRSRFEIALPPATLTASLVGAGVDLGDGDGPASALIQVGEIAEGTELTVDFQESDSGAVWTDIAGSASTDLSASTAVRHAFARTRRRLRCRATVAGEGASVALAVLVGQSCKVF